MGLTGPKTHFSLRKFINYQGNEFWKFVFDEIVYYFIYLNNQLIFDEIIYWCGIKYII